MTNITIAARFCGPPGSGNGGYTAGLLASALEGPVEVTLRAPPPLEVPLELTPGHERALLRGADGTLVAEAKRVAAVELALPEPVSFAEAERASANYVGFRDHPYPGCFVCGPSRPPARGAGLHLYPGAVSARCEGEPLAAVAAPFRPARDLCTNAGELAREFVWAALDCPSWFGHAAFLELPPPILLGRLTVSVARCPTAEEPCVVMGWSLGQEGRRINCGSALFDERGDCLAYARATWVELKAKAPPSP